MAEIFGYPAEDLTFARTLSLKAAKNGDKTFIHYLPDGRRFSYRDVHTISNRLANGFLANGIGKGTHVGVLMENCPEQILTFFALGKIGAVFTPLNPAAGGAFLEYYVNHSDSSAIVVEEHLLDQVREIAADIPILTRAFVLKALDPVEQSSILPSRIEEVDFASLYEHSDSDPEIETHFSDLCSLMYTSGTTGPSKGNMFSQAHTLTFGIGSRKAHQITPSDVIYCSLPLFHAGAWNTYTCGSLLDDGQIVLVRRFSVSRFWDEIRASGATVSFLSAVTHFLMAQPESPEDRTHGLRLFISGPMPANSEAFARRFGVQLGSSYGLTDYSLAHSFNPDDPPSKYGSCGKTAWDCESKIVDDDEFEVPPGVVGEILLRNNMPWGTSMGYYKMPEATLAAMRNMWFHTGDRGSIDADGYLYFADRKKDGLRRRGENISASEVEAAILHHPALCEAAVYGIKVEGTDDEVAVSVVLKEGATLDHRSLVDYCGKVLPYFIVPRFIEFVDALPRTPTHKVRKVELRERLQADLSSAWDREAHGIIFTRKAG